MVLTSLTNQAANRGLIYWRPTVDNEAHFAGVGGAKVVGDDALVAAFVGEGDAPQVQYSGVLCHCAAAPRSRPLVMGDVLHLGVAEDFMVLAPGEGHWRGAAAGYPARETHIAAQDGDSGLRLHGDLRLGEVVCRWVECRQSGGQKCSRSVAIQ